MGPAAPARSRRHSVGCFIQGLGPTGLDLDESRCGASRSRPVNASEADQMCQQLSLRVTL